MNRFAVEPKMHCGVLFRLSEITTSWTDLSFGSKFIILIPNQHIFYHQNKILSSMKRIYTFCACFIFLFLETAYEYNNMV